MMPEPGDDAVREIMINEDEVVLEVPEIVSELLVLDKPNSDVLDDIEEEVLDEVMEDGFVEVEVVFEEVEVVLEDVEVVFEDVVVNFEEEEVVFEEVRVVLAEALENVFDPDLLDEDCAREGLLVSELWVLEVDTLRVCRDDVTPDLDEVPHLP
jgi:hypothetical protein